MSVSEWSGRPDELERADLPSSVAAPGRTPATEGDGTPEPAEGKSAADWRPGDPGGSLVGQAAVSAEPPLCALDESNDTEAFAALPECVLCGGTGKQIPDGFWGEEPVSEDEATVEALSAIVHEQWMQSKRDQGVTSRQSETGEELMVPYGQLSEQAKDLDRGSVRSVLAAVRALREGGAS